MLRNDVSRLTKLHRSLIFPFGGNDLRTTFTLGLGLLCHCALHIVGKYNVFDLDRRYLCTPRLRKVKTSVIARKLKRSVGATYQQASKQGVTLGTSRRKKKA